ncbi:hypothetical protein T484DRAFT_1978544, partial [Baffinella frigidus]
LSFGVRSAPASSCFSFASVLQREWRPPFPLRHPPGFWRGVGDMTGGNNAASLGVHHFISDCDATFAV